MLKLDMIIVTYVSCVVWFLQVRRYSGKKTGISSAREIGSIQTGRDLTGVPGRATGKPRERIRLYQRREEEWVSRKLWCFTLEKHQKVPRLIGSCMSTVSSNPLVEMEAPR